MPKPTPAGARVLEAFDKRSYDTWEITSLHMSEVSRRSLIWSPQVYRVVGKLIRDGHLSGRASHEGMRYSRTDAGRAAIARVQS